MGKEQHGVGALVSNAANALRAGRPDDAIQLSLQAVARDPNHAGAHRTLADAYAVKGQLKDAERHYARALALKPDDVAYANLASVYAAGNDITRALQATMQGLKIKETSKLKSLFINYLRRAVSFPADQDLRDFLVRAMSEPWRRPGNFAGVSLAVLKQDSAIAAAIDRAVKHWPERATLTDLYGDALAHVSRDRLLRALLENTQLTDIPMERLLTLTRSALLDAVTTDRMAISSDEDTLAFFCALAQQCFTNEYVFACSEDETGKVGVLEKRLGAAEGDPLDVTAFAAYRPLHTLAACEVLQDHPWPEPVQKLFAQQVREPLAQRALRDGIPKLTPVNDGVSALVRQQYEENPYPRWVKTAPDMAPDTLDRVMQTRQPNSPYRPLGKDAPDILIAGCGTGQQVVEIATSILNARVTAVDLSLNSLSYAKHRTDVLGIRNVTYGQADILELPSLGQSFDLIVCSGVLHHMKDPLQGWRTLLSMLRPNGLMRIALYSEAARADVVAARQFIAERGYGASPEDIRRARQDILSLDGASPAKATTQNADFFGTSSCRDLLFHVQERRFTLPEIRAFLEEHNLDFLGFLLRPNNRRDYLKSFPDDPAGANLDNWQQFERQHPTFFRGMYQFHVQKRP